MSLKVLRRVIELIATLVLVTFFTFMLTALLPGNEAAVICSTSGAACIHYETVRLGLNKPLLDQYWIWLHHFVTGNLGYSYALSQPLTTVLKQSYGITLELIIYSQVVAVIVAIPLAMWAALRPNRAYDRVSTTLSFATLSLPPFIIGPILLLLFTVEIHAFPGAAASVPSIGSDPGRNLYVMFLPSMTLAVSSIAVYQRLLRADMIATLEEDYIVMARAKGLSTARILFRHALRPSTFSLITVGGVQVGSLITGAIIAEIVFGLHGLGSVITQAVSSKDYPTVQICTVIVALAYIVINLLIDGVYALIDPRIRRARATS